MKMHVHFYSHLIDTTSLDIALGEMEISTDERVELESISQDALHHAVMHAVMLKLSHEDKKVFLKQIALEDHPGIWRFLHKKTKNIESLIKKTAKELHEQLHEDIREGKKNQDKD